MGNTYISNILIGICELISKNDFQPSIECLRAALNTLRGFLSENEPARRVLETLMCLF
jgi:hypothetical protein